MPPRLLLLLVMVVAGMVVLLWIGFSINAGNSRPRAPQTRAAPDTERQSRRERERRIEFFESEVTAQLRSTDQANQQAARRCIEAIESNFQRYREGVDGFVDELTGLKSRFGILKRMPGAWWTGDRRVDDYVTEKFEKHLFSQTRLTSDLQIALDAFRVDIRANQNELLSRTQAAIDQSDLPPLRLDDYEAFYTSVSREILDLSASEAKTSVTEGMVTLIVSEAGSAAAVMIANRLLGSLTASASATMATAGGATAGGAAAGAAGGSVVPGAGTLVGFGVGAAVGLGIDYWMNRQTAAKLRAELLRYIDDMESDLLLGPQRTQSDGSTASSLGIQFGLDSACERLRDGVHQRLYEIIVWERSP